VSLRTSIAVLKMFPIATRRVAVYLGTHCNIDSKRAFPTAYSTSDTTVYIFTNAKAVYFLHSTISSVTCLRLNNVSVICCVTYFQFPIQSAFFHMGRQALALAALRHIGFNTQYRTLDVAENLGRYLSCTERTDQLNDFESILTVKMETTHTVEGQSGMVLSGDL